MRQSHSLQPHIHRQEPAADLDLRSAILEKLFHALGKDAATASERDWFVAVALVARDKIADRWNDGPPPAADGGRKSVNYLSIEFLIGRLLCDALTNLGCADEMRHALRDLGVDFDQIRAVEPDAALGSGGLGRLAACFLDSMATLGLASYGYGIRYRLGLFKQHMTHGWQQELPDDWLALQNPWEFERPALVYPVRFGGFVEYIGGHGTARGHWYPTETMLAMAYDTPVVGWRGHHAGTLRLWSARAADSIQPRRSGTADYSDALAAREKADQICRQLYPSDTTPAGQELRLRQEYFFTSASIQDIVHRHLLTYPDLDLLPSTAAIQLNDTHPAIAVAELMRILVDEHDHSWTHAWTITRQTLNYTNHTLLPEALESWPVAMLNALLPRHMQIIYLINHYHLKETAAVGFSDPDSVSALSLVSEGEAKRVRMGHLAFIGSRQVNGVSALHTELMQHTTFRLLNAALPGRIVNKTNGISVRRWLFEANPRLTSLIADTIGRAFLDNIDAIARLQEFAEDANFVRKISDVRMQTKTRVVHLVAELTGIQIHPDTLFDVHIKRIHEYKRQLLNILETVALYQAMRADPQAKWAPRTKIFAGKAAPDYSRAKLIIKLAHDVGQAINADPAVAGMLKVVFIPNYSVSLAEAIIPAADLSEQISTAGMEASGTGNMKLALNGALTIGTLDGANVEIRERVGADNFFAFGLSAEGVDDKRRARIQGASVATPVLQKALESIAAGEFSPGDPGRYHAIVDAVLDYDHFMVAADFDSYWQTQRSVDALWQQPNAWWKTSILNTARMSWFSSDRTIREYAQEIWGIERLP